MYILGTRMVIFMASFKVVRLEHLGQKNSFENTIATRV